MAPLYGYGYDLVSDHDDFGRALKASFRHFQALQDIMRQTMDLWRGCGSYLIDPFGLDYDPAMRRKQVLLFEEARRATNALEVGVHGGHSALICLLANPNISLLCVDTCRWPHVEACVDYLASQFPGRIRLVKGSSLDILPGMPDAAFDLIHIDGDHDTEVVKREIEQCLRLSHAGTRFVFDDYDMGVDAALGAYADALEVVEIPDCKFRNCIATRRSENRDARVQHAQPSGA